MSRDKQDQETRAWANAEVSLEYYLEFCRDTENAHGLVDTVWERVQEKRLAATMRLDYPYDDKYLDDPRHGQAAGINDQWSMICDVVRQANES